MCLQIFCRSYKNEALQRIQQVPFCSIENTQNLIQYLVLGLPGIVIVVVDWGSYEILSLMSAALGVHMQTSLILAWNFFDIISQFQCAF